MSFSGELVSSTPKFCETPITPSNNTFTHFEFPPNSFNNTLANDAKNSKKNVFIELTQENQTNNVKNKKNIRRSFTPIHIDEDNNDNNENENFLKNSEISPIEFNQNKQNKPNELNKITTEDNVNLMPPPFHQIHDKKTKTPSPTNNVDSISTDELSTLSLSQKLSGSETLNPNISNLLEKTLSISMILSNYGLSKYITQFSQLNLRDFLKLNDDDLIQMGFSDVTERKKILNATKIFDISDNFDNNQQ